jgi:tetrahedral aminopeptidase
MDQAAKDFLFELLQTPSPTGYEQAIQRVVKKRMKPYADLIEGDLHGNLMIALNHTASRKIMLTGHCDQIGMMVKHVSSDGFIYFTALGGVDTGVLLGTTVVIHGQKGPVVGVLWIDIGARNRKEVEKRVEIGDAITFKLGVLELANGLICAPGVDNKVGLFVAMEALRLCHGEKLSVGLFAVSTVQEEVGLRGAQTAAYRIAPEVGIAIDVTHASDNPGNENTRAVPCKLGSGPTITRGPNTNPIVEKMLLAAAKKGKIPFQLSPSSSLLGNDANIIQVSKQGVATASIGIPNRYMHTQAEISSLKDLENAAKLLAGFVKSIGKKTDFHPV